MFRFLLDAVARLRGRPRPRRPEVGDWDLARQVRAPDPYVWRLPSPHDARWRRWSRRHHLTGCYPPLMAEEDCWKRPARLRTPPSQTEDDMVRLYVLMR
ncbi:hypothetical protein [Streptomyces dioscori]|uniref:hypothetical protein n=1 Tax=Streptomyces dioscori TaxID=2109333 RepID=UPI00131A67A3|nr:hypothetical protein [Streptomyces dioscori]